MIRNADSWISNQAHWPNRRLVLLLLVFAFALLLMGCQREEPAEVIVEGGNPQQGEELVIAYECGDCHYIPGIEDTRGHDAPGLQLWANRTQVAGSAPNRPENVIAFIMDPQSIQPGSRMPSLGISEEEARHIAAYLFTVGAPD